MMYFQDIAFEKSKDHEDKYSLYQSCINWALIALSTLYLIGHPLHQTISSTASQRHKVNPASHTMAKIPSNNGSLALMVDTDGDFIDDEQDLDDDNDGIPDFIESGLTTICPEIGSPSFPAYDYTNCSSITGGRLFSNIGSFNGIAIDMQITNLTTGTVSCGLSGLNGCNAGDNGFTFFNTTNAATVDIGFYENGTTNPISVNWAIFLDDLDAVEGIALDSAYLFSYVLNTNNGTVVTYNGNRIDFDSNSNLSDEDELLLYLVNVQMLSLEFTHNPAAVRDVCMASAPGIMPSNSNCVLEKIIGIDTDNDGIPNHLDLDSDNDGILDIDEAGHSADDADNDGRIDGLPAAFGSNGLFDLLETSADSDTINYNVANSETTPDNDYDPYDLDADGDGCFDSIEEQVGDPDRDGIAGTGSPSVFPNGLVNAITYSAPSLHYWQNPSILGCNEICGDSMDNDGDGNADCLDVECCCPQAPSITK
ncbi:MAG: hypothetical protein AAF985_22345 [Bacteroidota bacterium]